MLLHMFSYFYLRNPVIVIEPSYSVWDPDESNRSLSTVRDLFRRLEVTGTTSPRKRSDRLNAFNEKDQASLKRLVKDDTARLRHGGDA